MVGEDSEAKTEKKKERRKRTTRVIRVVLPGSVTVCGRRAVRVEINA